MVGRVRAQLRAFVLHDHCNEVTNKKHHLLSAAILAARPHTDAAHTKRAMQVKKTADLARHDWGSDGTISSDEEDTFIAHKVDDELMGDVGAPSRVVLALEFMVDAPLDLFSLLSRAFNLLYDGVSEGTGFSNSLHDGEFNMSSYRDDIRMHDGFRGSTFSGSATKVDFELDGHSVFLYPSSDDGCISSGSQDTLHEDSHDEQLHVHEEDKMVGTLRWVDVFDSGDDDEKLDSGDDDTASLDSTGEDLHEKDSNVLHGDEKVGVWLVPDKDSGFNDTARYGSSFFGDNACTMHDDKTVEVAGDLHINAQAASTVYNHLNLESILQAPWRRRHSVRATPIGAGGDLHGRFDNILHEDTEFDHILHEDSLEANETEKVDEKFVHQAVAHHDGTAAYFDMAALDSRDDMPPYPVPPGKFNFTTNPGFGIRNLLVHGLHDKDRLQVHGEDEDGNSHEAVAHDPLHNTSRGEQGYFEGVDHLHGQRHPHGDGEDPREGQQGFIYMLAPLQGILHGQLTECISLDLLKILGRFALDHAYRCALTSVTLSSLSSRHQDVCNLIYRYKSKIDETCHSRDQWRQLYRDYKKRRDQDIEDRDTKTATLNNQIGDLKNVNSRLMQALYFSKFAHSLHAPNLAHAWHSELARNEADEPPAEYTSSEWALDGHNKPFNSGKFRKKSGNSGKTDNLLKYETGPLGPLPHSQDHGPRKRNGRRRNNTSHQTGPMGPSQKKKERSKAPHTTPADQLELQPGCAENPSCAPSYGTSPLGSSENSGNPDFFTPYVIASKFAATDTSKLSDEPFV